LDSTGCVFTSFVNPSGGFVAGDHLSIHASLEREAHVVISTPSANRVYPLLGAEAKQALNLSVASGAVLEWFPEVTIPFAGSRVMQTVYATLAAGSTVLIWDTLPPVEWHGGSTGLSRHCRTTFASRQRQEID
jgi:urease accessory protein